MTTPHYVYGPRLGHQARSRSWVGGMRADASMSPHVGAPPKSVEAGLPGARDEVRAYSKRVDTAIEDFQKKDVEPLEDAPPSGFVSWLADWLPWRRKWQAYRDKIEGFDLFGPTPSEAWQRIQLFEEELAEKRDELEKLTGKPLASKNKGPLEEPRGVKQTPVAWYVAGALAAALFVVVAVRLA